MTTWLSMRAAPKQFGHPNVISLRRRIQQLREQGKVEDIGAMPEKFVMGHHSGPVKVYWLNSRTMQVDTDAPTSLLAKKRSKSKSKKKSR